MPVGAPAVVKRPTGRYLMTPEAVRPQQPVLIPVQKVAPLAPFAVTKTQMIQFEHSAPVTSAACPAGTAKLNINGLKVRPGMLEVWTQLENGDTEPGCASVYLELLDQRGARDPARATLLKSDRGNTAPMRQTQLTLPENNQRVQLRFGPQAKPLAVIDVDLAKGTATAR